MDFSTGVIEYPVIKNANKYYFKILHSGKDNYSGEESSTKSVVTRHKCGKKDRKFSDWDSSERSTIKLPK